MNTNWRTVAMVVAVFWIGNFLTVGFRDYASASEQTRKVSGQLIEARAKISSGVVDCQLQTNGISSELGAQKAQNSTLQKQNRDEQVLIAGCQSEAIKRLSPEPLKVTPVLLEGNNSNVAVRTIKLLVITNRIIPHPITALIQCNAFIESVSFTVLGAMMSSPGAQRIAPNAFQINENAADWGPVSPMITTISYRGSAEVGCSVAPR